MPFQSHPMLIMGVINVTPDSFSDGGEFLASEKAIRCAQEYLDCGADLLDLGAESTRPGAEPVGQVEEWTRLEPVIQGLVAKGWVTHLSIDSRNDCTLLAAHELGAKWFNNIGGLAKPDTLKYLATDPETKYIAMHMHRNPGSMQADPLGKTDALTHVRAAFENYEKHLMAAGFTKNRIYLDPGIGFGKTVLANLDLLDACQQFAQCYNLLVGVSRKSFIGKLLNITSPKDRDEASKMIEMNLWRQGVQIIRTHDVRTLSHIRQLLSQEC